MARLHRHGLRPLKALEVLHPPRPLKRRQRVLFRQHGQRPRRILLRHRHHGAGRRLLQARPSEFPAHAANRTGALWR